MEELKNLLEEYLSIDTTLGGLSEIPTMPNVVTNLLEAKTTVAEIDFAIRYNKTVYIQQAKKKHRKKEVESEIREIHPMNCWIPVKIDSKTYYIGFETSDWPMHVPEMLLKKEGEELRTLKHRLT